MVLIDKGNGKDLEFGHTNYRTGEGRAVTHSQNQKERYVNPELTVEERHAISVRDALRRNKYSVSLLCENNTRIELYTVYNHLTEDLSMSVGIYGSHGKKVFRLNQRRKRKNGEEDRERLRENE